MNTGPMRGSGLDLITKMQLSLRRCEMLCMHLAPRSTPSQAAVMPAIRSRHRAEVQVLAPLQSRAAMSSHRPVAPMQNSQPASTPHRQLCVRARAASTVAPTADVTSPPASPPDSIPASPASGYKVPPKEILDIVDFPPQPGLSYSPDKSMFLQTFRPPSLPPIIEMSRPELKLGGLRIDPDIYSRSKMGYTLGMAIVPATEVVPAADDKLRHIKGYPEGSWLNYISWSPDNKHIAFTVRSPGGPNDPPRKALELWIADVATGQARVLLKRGLNTVFDDYTWQTDTTIVATVLPENLGPMPQKPLGSVGPKIQDNTSGKKSQNRTYPDLLKDQHDVALFEHFGMSEIVNIEILTGKVTPIGPPRLYTDLDASPDGRYLLASWLEPPYSFSVPCGRFPKREQLWRPDDGSFVREMYALPLAEDIPIAFNSVRVGPRGLGWRDDKPAEMCWTETQDGGDPDVEVSPRDIIYTLCADEAAAAAERIASNGHASSSGGSSSSNSNGSMHRANSTSSTSSVSSDAGSLQRPDGSSSSSTSSSSGSDGGGLQSTPPASSSSSSISNGTSGTTSYKPSASVGPGMPQVLATTDLRCGGVAWCDGDLAMVYESWWKTRKSVIYTMSPDRREEGKQVLFDRNYEDVYTDPGSPLSRRTANGTYIIAKLDGQRKLLLTGSGASPEGNKPFLDVLDLDTKETKRLWQSAPPFYEQIGSIMSDGDPDAPITLDGLQLSYARETAKEPPQTYIKTFSGPAAENNTERPVTQYPHPYPQLRDMQREVLRYPRADGVMLTATLYTPPGYDKDRDGPLPCIAWAYPREFKSKEAAGQMRRSPYTFASIGSLSPTLWVARGYAVLDGPTFPIVAEGDEEPNDTFVEQLTAGARAAIDTVVAKGIVDPARVSVGGHSYGAFMTANLLAHAPELFACGVARTGAYNRTLTPFGFQSEERTLWQAPDVYAKMSPFMHADKVKKPILLVHGEDDNNPGTFPLQSERFYQALKGHGAAARLVLLPYESHGYQARESVLHTLYEQDQFFEKYAGFGRVDASYGAEAQAEEAT